MIVLNLKNYKESFERLEELVISAKEVNEESGVRVIVSPPDILLLKNIEKYWDIYSQHCDEYDFGAHTGSLLPSAIKLIGVKGSLVNHSEKRIPVEKIEKIIKELNENSLESILCAENPKEVGEFSRLNPTFIAVEPKELIGTGISISTAKPEVITKSIDMLREVESKVPLLCGAGVSKKEDVIKALELGSKGVLLASAFVKAENPKKFIEEFASAF